MIPRIPFIVGLLLVTLVGAPQGAEGRQSQPAAATGASSDALLRPGDFVEIRVWPANELSGEFAIEDTGLIHLPLLGPVRAVGIPIGELREELRRGYGQTMQNPVVTVTPHFRVSVTGEVQRPGIQIVSPSQTLFDVIGLAGGFRGGADTENVRIVRPGQVIDFDALRAMETGEGMDPVVLRSGDHIIVPAQRPSRLTWRNAFEAARTVSTLVLVWDRLFR